MLNLQQKEEIYRVVIPVPKNRPRHYVFQEADYYINLAVKLYNDHVGIDTYDVISISLSLSIKSYMETDSVYVDFYVKNRSN